MTDVKKRKPRVRVVEQARAYAEEHGEAMGRLGLDGDQDGVKRELAKAFIAGRRSAAPLATGAKKHKPDFCPECGDLALETHVHCSGCGLVMRNCTCQLEIPLEKKSPPET